MGGFLDNAAELRAARGGPTLADVDARNLARRKARDPGRVEVDEIRRRLRADDALEAAHPDKLTPERRAQLAEKVEAWRVGELARKLEAERIERQLLGRTEAGDLVADDELPTDEEVERLRRRLEVLDPRRAGLTIPRRPMRRAGGTPHASDRSPEE